jgi:hypothetical protein
MTTTTPSSCPVTTKLTCENYRQRLHQVSSGGQLVGPSKKTETIEVRHPYSTSKSRLAKSPSELRKKKTAPFSPQLKLFSGSSVIKVERTAKVGAGV